MISRVVAIAVRLAHQFSYICMFLGRFGSSYRSNVTGIIYNNEMADFDIPGLRPVGGIYPSSVNFPEAGKRPFSSMSPAILTDDNGDVQLVIGASGGKRITTAVSLVRRYSVTSSLQETRWELGWKGSA